MSLISQAMEGAFDGAVEAAVQKARRLWDAQRDKDIGELERKTEELALVTARRDYWSKRCEEIDRMHRKQWDNLYAFANAHGRRPNERLEEMIGRLKRESDGHVDEVERQRKIIEAGIVVDRVFTVESAPADPELAAAERRVIDAAVGWLRDRERVTGKDEAKTVLYACTRLDDTVRALDALRAARTGKVEEEALVEQAMAAVAIGDFIRTPNAERVIRKLHAAGMLRPARGEGKA